MATALIGDSNGLQPSVTAGSLYVSLHHGDPGAAGNQTTNETAYTNYGRIGVSRDTSNWLVSGSAPTQVANGSVVSFAACGVTGDTLTYFGVGASSGGAGKLLYSGTLTASLVVSAGITPQFTVGNIVITED